MCYTAGMATTINQRELRNNSGEIMRALDRGEEFIVTRHGVPVGELRPLRRRFVSRQVVAAVMATAPPIDADRLREDLDRIVDQQIEPRA
jgi:prevent-host-death family protein